MLDCVGGERAAQEAARHIHIPHWQLHQLKAIDKLQSQPPAHLSAVPRSTEPGPPFIVRGPSPMAAVSRDFHAGADSTTSH
jgi:hypothetical protein